MVVKQERKKRKGEEMDVNAEVLKVKGKRMLVNREGME